ncbi:MAG: hypothetical protein VB008_00080 [Candidatus Elulimicrobiales bacterium]|nr:hypothetical protein [Candidatus Elulimicrobiales bacterium]
MCLVCEKPGKMLCDNCGIKIINDKRKDSDLENISWVHNTLNYQNNTLQKIFYSLKYNYTKAFVKDLSELVKKDFLSFLEKILKTSDSTYEKLIFIPIPISKKRLIERDYNQSELLLKETLRLIKKENNIDLEKNILLDFLVKTKHTIKFAKTHSRNEREKLIKDAFSINEKTLESFPTNFLSKKIFILFDDITTTGTTFYEARKVLINSNIPKGNIFAYALAH